MQWRNIKGGMLTSYNKNMSTQKPNGIINLDGIMRYRQTGAWNFPLVTSDPVTGSIWAIGGDDRVFNGVGMYRTYSTSNSPPVYKSSPAQVGAVTTWSSVAAGLHHSLAIKNDNTLWSWGRNTFGATALGGNSGGPGSYARNTYQPAQLGMLTNWSKISAGYHTSAAIKTDGTLWVWGLNLYGELGLGNKINYSSPKQVGLLTNWRDVYPGTRRMFAIKTDGTLWTWGNNTGGSLGLGNTTNYSSPKQIGSRTDWKQIVNVGAKSVFGLTTDGSLWFWGQDMSGVSFYSGTQVSFTSPILISNEKWLKLGSSQVGSSSYANNILGIKNDGSLWIWGTNSSALVGYAFYGGPPAITSPILVDSSKNWFDAAVINYGLGNAAVAAIKTDGTLWTWGRNLDGQLGLNNTTGYSLPKQVGSSTNWRRISGSRRHFLAIRS